MEKERVLKKGELEGPLKVKESEVKERKVKAQKERARLCNISRPKLMVVTRV